MSFPLHLSKERIGCKADAQAARFFNKAKDGKRHRITTNSSIPFDQVRFNLSVMMAINHQSFTSKAS
jgi:hypothetical protein